VTIDVQTANLKEVIMPKAQRPSRIIQKTQRTEVVYEIRVYRLT